jgi:hypothetical protein
MNVQNSNFISKYAQAVNDLLDARSRLKALRERDQATGIVAALTPEDFAGTNAYLSKPDVEAALATMDPARAGPDRLLRHPAGPDGGARDPAEVPALSHRSP